MPGSLQHKLSQYEVLPPSAIWESISSRLDEEYSASDLHLSDKLDQAVITPPVSAWAAISSELDATNLPAKILPMRYKRVAMAAILAGVVATGIIYMFSGNSITSNKSAVASIQSTDSSISYGTVEEEPSSPLPGSTPSGKQTFAYNGSGNSIDKNIKRPIAHSAAYTYNTRDNFLEDLDPAYVNTPQTVSALQPVSVTAPPIRDDRGNIIMDMHVISKPNNHFITVTSPNGTQTRISNKFLSCLSYFNNDYSSAEMNSEGHQCKTQFKAWRDKLLSEAAFIPSVNNFFDIFELQELIEERQ